MKDENGNLTIDEGAAYSDANKIDQANADLAQARKALTQLYGLSQSIKGQTGSAISEKTGELINRLDQLSGQLQNSSAYIRRTVRYYQQKDEELSQQVRG